VFPPALAARTARRDRTYGTVGPAVAPAWAVAVDEQRTAVLLLARTVPGVRAARTA